MNGIAVYYEGICIYWSSIIIVAGIVTGFMISLALFTSQNKYAVGFCFYIPNAIIAGILLSRFLYWFCNKEQFSGMEEAFKSFQKGGFLIPGIIISAIVVAVILRLLKIVPSVNSILDPLAVGMAFMIGTFKFSCYFTDVCRGKLLITNPDFQGLPFSVASIDSAGNIQYRLATFFITFICMMIITILLTALWIIRQADTRGHVFRIFLYLYALVEIIMDSTRYDAAHPTFEGEAFEGLNKASGFMGLGQLFGAVSILYVFIYYFVIKAKREGFHAKNIVALIMYIIGFATAGGSEYLVQRFSSQMVGYYCLMLSGLILIGISLLVLLIVKKEAKVVQNDTNNSDKDNYIDNIIVNLSENKVLSKQ